MFAIWMLQWLLVASVDARHAGAWMDRPVVGWNVPGGKVPRAPHVPVQDRYDRESCGQWARRPRNAIEKAVAAAGWELEAPSGHVGPLRTVLGMANRDGMCRPELFQVFYFLGDQFIGTVSPVPMDSRSDGVVQEEKMRGDRLEVEYRRYAPQDPLCCPSRKATLLFRIDRSNPHGPALMPDHPSRRRGRRVRAAIQPDVGWSVQGQQ